MGGVVVRPVGIKSGEGCTLGLIFEVLSLFFSVLGSVAQDCTVHGRCCRFLICFRSGIFISLFPFLFPCGGLGNVLSFVCFDFFLFGFSFEPEILPEHARIPGR